MTDKPETTEPEKENIQSKIWREVPEDDNPFAAKTAFCSGFDVYGDLLGKISWIEYLYLLFKLEPPTKSQAQLLEGLAVAIANPGPRDLSVRAAMNGAVAGSLSASSLMAAVACGSGGYTGARELYLAKKMCEDSGTEIDQWQSSIQNFEKTQDVRVWPDVEHIPGFDPYGASCPTTIKQTLAYLASIDSTGNLAWLNEHREALEGFVNSPMNMIGIAAATLDALEFSLAEAEMLFLLLRLPGAAAHAVEQQKLGWKKYPFFLNGLTLTKDSESHAGQKDHA